MKGEVRFRYQYGATMQRVHEVAYPKPILSSRIQQRGTESNPGDRKSERKERKERARKRMSECPYMTSEIVKKRKEMSAFELL